MIVQVNDKSVEVAENCSVAQLAQQLQLPERGVAVAVNNDVIPRNIWHRTLLESNFKIMIVMAVSGG